MQKRYENLADTGKEQAKSQTNSYQQHINDLTRINAQNEAEKDLLRLAIRLQQSLHTLMLDIDEQPTKEALLKFEQAVLATNTVLFKLKEELFEVPITYFSRNSERAEEIEGKSTGQVIEGNIYPVEKCHKCGTQNRIRYHKTNLDPICGNCKHRLTEEVVHPEAVTFKEDRELIKTPGRDFSGTFATYEPYLNWFCKSFPAMAPLGQEQFYRSVRYSGTSQSTRNKKYRDNKKSKTDLSYLD